MESTPLAPLAQTLTQFVGVVENFAPLAVGLAGAFGLAVMFSFIFVRKH